MTATERREAENQPLDGPRNFLVVEQGPFVLRCDVAHTMAAVAQIRLRRMRMENLERRMS